MIGPRICGACRTLMHAPTVACPEPYEADPAEFAPLDPFTNQPERNHR